ncbi:dimethylarginine dimethylaminohydrolase family protein [Halobacillus litoralis]|uniref:dimethylarginine dimethylaminohydrolase family protein n=1 Tax=Halobacillus litoralis TaxID=45668 RepID=UPI001CFD0125|nr:arginine deiminase family protein [Halobacillus litoralis]
MKSAALKHNIHCKTEYDPLNQVIVTEPRFMSITNIINETQKHYEHADIDTRLALTQHRNFVKVLKENKVIVHQLPAIHELNEQVFTRDIGFVIEDQFYVGNMSETIRQKETVHLKKWLINKSIAHQKEFLHPIEGGDVLLDGSTIWVGLSGRTSHEAVEELKSRRPNDNIEALTLKSDVLHLDCVLNIIDKGTALIYPPAFTPQGLNKLRSRFSLIPVTQEEQFFMGPNVLSLGHQRIISLSSNVRLNQRMTSNGFQVLPVQFSEIIKSGGSFRCCTLPLERKKVSDKEKES